LDQSNLDLEKDLDNSIDKTTITQLREDLGGDFKELLDIFLEDSPKLISAIKEAVKALDMNGVNMGAHTLKSSSGNMGAKNLFDYCKTLEGLGKSEIKDGMVEELEKIEHEYSLVREFLLLEKDKK